MTTKRVLTNEEYVQSTTGSTTQKKTAREHAESPKTKRINELVESISFCSEDSDGTATAVPLLENSRNYSYRTIGTEPNMAGAPRRCRNSQRRNSKTGFKYFIRIYDWLPDSVQFTFQHEEEEEEETYFDIQFPHDEYTRDVESPH
jgi:hypothetical protein